MLFVLLFVMEDQRLQGVISVHVGLITYSKHVFRFRIQTWLILRFTTLWSYLSLKDYRTVSFPELRQTQLIQNS